eukprot:6097718-Alexandrium_andersonii.AAC.1
MCIRDRSNPHRRTCVIATGIGSSNCSALDGPQNRSTKLPTGEGSAPLRADSESADGRHAVGGSQ